MSGEENYGPLFSGDEKDLYRIAFENVTAATQEETGDELVAIYCENCGEPADSTEHCKICLFYWCEKCINSSDHEDTHRVGARHEERS